MFKIRKLSEEKFYHLQGSTKDFLSAMANSKLLYTGLPYTERVLFFTSLIIVRASWHKARGFPDSYLITLQENIELHVQLLRKPKDDLGALFFKT